MCLTAEAFCKKTSSVIKRRIHRCSFNHFLIIRDFSAFLFIFRVSIEIFFKMPTRHTLRWMFFFLFVCNTFVTLNINIAIVSMVNYSNPGNENLTTDVLCPNTTSFWEDTSEKNSSYIPQEGKYNWSEYDQNVVLSGYHWLSWLSILPAGILTQHYGSKIVLGYSQGISSAMSSLIPIFASNDPTAVTYIRVVQGLFSFMAVPGGIFTIMGNWIPPQERGQFTSIILIGATVGFGTGSVLFGSIAQYIHWHYVFHLTSVCGLVWTVLWYWLIYDTPLEHPNISVKEKNFITGSLKYSAETVKIPIPWKEILTSLSFFACALGVGGMTWHFFMLTMYMPSYLKAMYGMNSNQIGFLTSIPQFASGLLAFMFGFLSDLIMKKKWLSITHSRKIFSFFGGIVAAVPLIIIAYAKCDIILIIACFMFATISRLLNAFGVELALIDMSPKFCGILQGFAGTVGTLMTLSLSVFINYVSAIASSEDLWRIVFLSAGCVCIILNSFFIICGTADTQPWNFGSRKLLMKDVEKN